LPGSAAPRIELPLVDLVGRRFERGHLLGADPVLDLKDAVLLEGLPFDIGQAVLQG